MNLKILLPFQVFAEQTGVTRIVAETREGSFGLLPHRRDCIAALVPGILIYQTDGDGAVSAYVVPLMATDTVAPADASATTRTRALEVAANRGERGVHHALERRIDVLVGAGERGERGVSGGQQGAVLAGDTENQCGALRGHRTAP